MSHTLKKKEVVIPKYASRHQKVARLHSGNSITAQKLLRRLDKEKVDGTKSSKEK